MLLIIKTPLAAQRITVNQMTKDFIDHVCLAFSAVEWRVESVAKIVIVQCEASGM